MKTVPVTFQIILFFLLFAFFCFQPSPAFSQDWIYTVQKGDNLWKIGKKNLKSMRYWKKLVDHNQLKDPFHLQPGSKIHIPFDWLKKGASAAKLVAISGNALVTRNNSDEQVKAAVNMYLWQNDRLQTTPHSNVTLKFADGSEVLVQAGSEVIIGKLMQYGANGMTETNLFLKSGRTQSKVIRASDTGSRFEIKTPSAVAAVRGTEYRIGANLDGSSLAEVLEGAVQLDSSGKGIHLEDGYGSVTFLDKQPLPPIKLLPPPDISRLPAKIVRTPFSINIQPSTDVNGYRLQIATDENFRSLLFDKTFSESDIFGPEISNGTYYLRVNGIDKNGLEGLYSFHKFSIAAHPVPPKSLSPITDAVIENCQPTFHWSQQEEAKHYHFQLADNNQFTTLLADANHLNNPQYNLQEPLAPGLYHWRLASTTSSGHQGPYSEPQQFRCLPLRLDISKATMDKEEKIYRWDESKTESRYHLQISRDKTFANPSIDQELTEPQVSLQTLTPGTYYIHVAAITSDGFTGPYSLPQTITVEPPPPHPLIIAGSALLMIAVIFL